MLSVLTVLILALAGFALYRQGYSQAFSKALALLEEANAKDRKAMEALGIFTDRRESDVLTNVFKKF